MNLKLRGQNFWTTLTVVGAGPVWEGTYALTSNCNTNTCCCPKGNIVLTRSSSTTALNFLSAQFAVTGYCGLTTSISQSTTYPTGYSWSVAYGLATVQFTLSADSSSISGAIVGTSLCSMTAKKIN
ncbi:unnamed protein product [Rotaria sp. Silwood2]|nr:unnamed protein product [Rotaria sp. Silwood2]CAF4288603.1 unnamed protein product [Rotaria sp. Silwood2]